MQITFRPKERHPHCWEIVVNGEKWREVHRAIFGKKPLFPSLASESELHSIFNDFEYRRTKGYVLWRLSNQSYHSEQLAKLLSIRLVQSQTIQRVLLECQEMGLLNDDTWLQNFIRVHQKRYSMRVILSKLYSKGLSTDTLKNLEEKSLDSEGEWQAIHHLIRTRYRSKDLSDYKTKQKVLAALLRKGFAFEQIQMALLYTISTR